MKQRYSHELPRWMRWLGIWRINEESIDFKWKYFELSFAPRWAFSLQLLRGGYFDQRYMLNLALGWGQFYITLPIKTRLAEGCHTPRYGIAIHNNAFWIYTGGKYDESIGQCTGNDQWITWDLPFFTWVFEGHWIKDQNSKWVKMQQTKLGVGDSNPSPYKFRKTRAHAETYSYVYILDDGTVQNRTARCTEEYRAWHRKWAPALVKWSRVIDVEFNDEVGERSGSWKGGVLGCSYEMYDNETMGEALRRMEVERKF